MAGSIFNLDGNAFHGSTRGLIHPSHILMLHELPEEEDAVVNPQELSRELPPEARQERGEQGADLEHTEDSCVLNSVMAHAVDLNTFQEFESYLFYVDADSESDVPEDYDETSDDEFMIEISRIEEEPSPVALL